MIDGILYYHSSYGWMVPMVDCIIPQSTQTKKMVISASTNINIIECYSATEPIFTVRYD
jgi:hypothetical protein